MRIAKIMENDVVDGDGICVSVWFQGCPHRCKGCHNPDTWAYNGGTAMTEEELVNTVLPLINKNGIQRNLSLLGGEPLCPENAPFALALIEEVKKQFPDIKVFTWTGYTIEELHCRPHIASQKLALYASDVVIDGRYVEELRDITLYLRGSSNQRIWVKDGENFKIFDKSEKT